MCDEILELKNKFNEIFNTKITLRKMKLIKIIYEYIADCLYKTTNTNKKLRNKYVKDIDLFINTLSEEQLQMYLNLEDKRSEISALYEEQFFVYGLLMANEIKTELMINK